ncbi:MAG: elongation factor Ts [Abditibacteriota bacterium]|nr:elongation factor Ts [Abditibacteriota bacterium]
MMKVLCAIIVIFSLKLLCVLRVLCGETFCEDNIMATINAADVKKLREMTSAGIMDCKSALTESGGDFDKAVALLREKSLASAVKKADRATAEGLVGVHVSDDGKRAGIIEVNCETDFVARNDKFQELARDLAQQVEQGSAGDVAALLQQPLGDKNVDAFVREAIGTVGENIQIARFEKFETSGELGIYTHTDGKQAAVVEILGGSGEQVQQLARDLAMQVVAMRPQYVSRDEVPAVVLEGERRIYEQQAAQEGKPEAIQTKIAEGRLNKEFYQAVSLMDQPFIREQKQTIAQMVKAAGSDLKVARFVRYKVGEAS